MLVQLESSWSSILYAAASLDEQTPDAARTAAIAKAYAARATQEVAHGALQVFGGIAFTAEHPAHRYLRRIVVRAGSFGSARDHERAIARTLASSCRTKKKKKRGGAPPPPPLHSAELAPSAGRARPTRR